MDDTPKNIFQSIVDEAENIEDLLKTNFDM